MQTGSYAGQGDPTAGHYHIRLTDEFRSSCSARQLVRLSDGQDGIHWLLKVLISFHRQLAVHFRRSSTLNHNLITALSLTVIVAIVPLVTTNHYYLTTIVLAFIFALFATSWNLLMGYARIASFGQAGLFAVGAYTDGLLIANYHISPWIALIAGGLMAILFGLLMAIPSMRTGGLFVGIITLGFALLNQTADENLQFLGGPLGFAIPKTFPQIPLPLTSTLALDYFYYIYLVILIGFTLCTYYYTSMSKMGLITRAAGMDDLLARLYGINTVSFKLIAFSLSALIAGIAGGLYANFILAIDPSVGSVTESTTIIAMVILGGLGTPAGPIVGAALLTVIQQATTLYVAPVYGVIVAGAIIVVFIILLPGGLMSIRKAILRLKGIRGATILHDKPDSTAQIHSEAG